MRADRRTRRIVAGLLIALCAAACVATDDPDAFDADVLVRGGTVVDGTGGPPRLADVAVRDGIVTEIGDLRTLRARREIDAAGLVVAPGFVDLHSHADLIVLAGRETQETLLAAKILQGVTTVVVGNCGLGVAPTSPKAADLLAGVNGWMTPQGVAAGPLDVAGYLGRLERSGVALNVATLVPHGPVRVSELGLAGGLASDAAIETMRAEVRRGLDQGALGLSVGLIYPPGMYSDTAELTALAGVVADADALFSAHVRGSSETLMEATGELIEIARRSGARVHHSHLEAVGERFWDRVPEVLALEDAAREEGLRITHDVFPYTRAATMMTAIFPPWALDGGVPALLDRLGRDEERRRIAADIAGRSPEWPPWAEDGWPHNLVGAVGWDGIIVASVAPGGPTELVGRDLETIAAGRGRDPFDVVADLMLDQNARVGQFVDEISGRGEELEALLTIFRHPSAAIVSDAEDYGRGAPHPAHAGAFARALRLNRERSLMSLQELIRRMTSHPAGIGGLADRGELRVGRPADIVVFDPAATTDRASWRHPRETATGIGWVLVNGRVVVESGSYAGGLHGAVLRRAGTDSPARPPAR